MKDLKELGPALRNLMVVTENPYETNRGELMIYRMRLFTPSERGILRTAMTQHYGIPCIQGGAGLMDELEMVNFECNGQKITDLRCQIR